VAAFLISAVLASNTADSSSLVMNLHLFMVQLLQLRFMRILDPDWQHRIQGGPKDSGDQTILFNQEVICSMDEMTSDLTELLCDLCRGQFRCDVSRFDLGEVSLRSREC